MRISDIPIPEIYLESSDFRFFLKWFEAVLTRINFDTENVIDLYDPQRCPENLLWMLADTMGYKYDDRLSPAFCRLVLLYFMSMIKYKGSKSGVTLAAEVNLAQFNLQDYAKEKDILNNRLEDTSIPVNSVYVTAHTAEGYIDVVYFSTKKPIDACIEYVRPLGMYCFQHSGVSFNGRTKISIDGRLTNIKDTASGEGITRVGHYSREDYARMQKMDRDPDSPEDLLHTRQPAWSRNSLVDQRDVDAGYRALYSLQMSNNEHIVKSLLDPIFDLNYGPQEVAVIPYDDPSKFDEYPKWNLRYNQTNEENITSDIYTNDPDAVISPPQYPVTANTPRTYPAVNPIMAEIGDAILLNIDSMLFSINIMQGKSYLVNNVLPVLRIISCKYGITPPGKWTTLQPGKDYQVTDGEDGAKYVKILSSSEVVPPTPAVGMHLLVTYEYDQNTKYTHYKVESGDPQIEIVPPSSN